MCKNDEEFQRINDLEIKEVADTILEQIDYRWNDPGMTALTATFLDPRFKDLNFLTHVK
nr:13225_t:CDS:2 [Entrophospora candida]